MFSEGKKGSISLLKPNISDFKQKPSVIKDTVNFARGISEALVKQKKIFQEKQPGVIYPEFPDDLTLLSIEQLGKLQSVYTSWSNYIDEILAVDLSDMMYYENKRDYEETLVRLTSKGTFHSRKDFARANETVAMENMRYLELKAKVEILKAKLRSCERAWRSISRELSRRQINLDLEN